MPSKRCLLQESATFTISASPDSAMTRQRLNAIFWCLHLSDSDEDEKNEEKKRTPQLDRPFNVRSLYNDITCPANCLQSVLSSLPEAEDASHKSQTRFQMVFTTKTNKVGDKNACASRHAWLHVEFFNL